MNLNSTQKQSVVASFAAANVLGYFRQKSWRALFSTRPMIPTFIRASKPVAVIAVILAMLGAGNATAQTNYYTTNGTEYALIGSLSGDQVFSDVSISTTGGFITWQDNITDGDGWGISARRLESTLSGTLGVFRVNSTAAANQENPRVALLKDNGAAFVWQGGKSGFQHIYARFINSSNVFLMSTDVVVSATSRFQMNPALAVLSNSNVVVVWSSYNEASSNSWSDIYGQILTPQGQKVGGQFLINQTLPYNQRNPAVSALVGGGFVVAWVSEQQISGASSNSILATAVSSPRADIYARLFDNSAAPTSSEFLVNSSASPCASPAIAANASGGYNVVWSARDLARYTNGWDIYSRSMTGTSGATVIGVNSYILGNQLSPKISVVGTNYLVCWTSDEQDGSGSGIFGRFLKGQGTLVDGEFRVNTTTVSKQIQPAVAADGVGRFLVVWSSYVGSPYNFELNAQRYSSSTAPLPAMSAPYVWVPFVVSNNVYQPRMLVSWTPLQGLSVSNYEVYVDGISTPIATVITNQWTMTAAHGLTTNSTHSFKLAYVLPGGYRSPLSAATTATTWRGQSWGGIPFEWMTANYGDLTLSFVGGVPTYNWPFPDAVLVTGGPTLLKVFLTGGNPFDSSTWLQQQLSQTPQGLFLSWNTQPGAMYQVQVTTNFVSWLNYGTPRFAAGSTDSIYVGGSTASYYRVQLLR